MGGMVGCVGNRPGLYPNVHDGNELPLDLRQKFLALELANSLGALGPPVECPLSNVDGRLHVLFAGVLQGVSSGWNLERDEAHLLVEATLGVEIWADNVVDHDLRWVEKFGYRVRGVVN